MKKRCFSLFMALMMLVSVFPVNVFAENENLIPEEPVTEVVDEGLVSAAENTEEEKLAPVEEAETPDEVLSKEEETLTEPAEEEPADQSAEETIEEISDTEEETVGEQPEEETDEELPEEPVDPEEPVEIVLSATADGVVITLTAEAGAFGEWKAEDLTLSVQKIEEASAEAESIEEAVAENRAEDVNLVSSYKFDITVLDKDGAELQPIDGATVKVSFALAEVSDSNLNVSVYHVKEAEGEALTAEELATEEVPAEEAEGEESVVTVETDGFSYYVVEFTYNNLQFVLQGDENVALSVILASVGLNGTVTSAVSSNEELFTVVKDAEGEDWTVSALQPFSSEEQLKIAIGGTEYIITVTDDTTAPGTRQQITKEELEDGVFFVYHAVENGVTLTLYCFNSELAWPVTGNPELTDYYVPDEMLTLSEDVKDKVYRILYAGYPHNNLGLYSTGEEPISYSELADAVVPPQALKDLLPGYDWDNLNFTPENLIGDTPESQVMDEMLWSMWDDDCYEAMLSKPNFLTFLSAWQFGPYPTVDDLLDAYAEMKPTSSPGDVHDATQIAIWRILYENKVPNNGKPLTEELNQYPLAKQLVDFANGVGEYADAPIPPRGTKISEMETYKASFETGSKLLRADGSAVGADGIIVFTENENGEYVSEPLHFAADTYALPYTITLSDGTTAVSSVINHGTGEFVLYSPSRPASGQVTVETENLYPSDVYQYVVESQEDIPAEDLSHDKGHVQDMSGVYYQRVPMALSFGARFQDVGDLAVTKKVAGSWGDRDMPFSFTVTLDNNTINGTYGEMTFTNGVASFTLKHDEIITAKDIPTGTGYTVTETVDPNLKYSVSSDHATGTITDEQTALATFTNTRDAVGSLKVTKSVTGYVPDAETTKAFEFTVTLSDASINGTYGEMTFTDGVASFTLQNAQSRTADNLPNGIDYVVTEKDYGPEGYSTHKTGDTGMIVLGETQTAAFTNTRNADGSLTISKTVEGNDIDPTKEFEFTITLTPTVTATYSGVDFTNGVATITLRDGQSKEIDGITAGTVYTVTETSVAGYTTKSSGSGGEMAEGNTATGTIEGNKASEAEFVNTRNTFGSLMVSKTVAGNAGSRAKEFNFTVLLKDRTISGPFGDMTFENGEATFALKHGESKKATGLPNGIEYEVREHNYISDGYSTQVSGDTGVIVGNSTQTAAFINTRNANGSLTISKTLEGNDIDPTQDFEFTITLTPAVEGDENVLNGTFSGVQFTNGQAKITLKGGETKVFTDLPNGTGYSVVETTIAGYEMTSSGTTGIIDEHKSAVAAFVNTRNTYGDLAVSKTVVDGKTLVEDTATEFIFTVVLSDRSINGRYGTGETYMTFENGVATFTLKHGETRTAVSLPNGIEYTVEEQDYTEDGYITTWTGNDQGRIIGGDTQTVAYTNTRIVGSLEIAKELEGSAADPDYSFEFTITLDGVTDATYSGVIETKDGTKTISVVFTNGVATVELKGGEVLILEGIPVGTGYSVTEKDYSAVGYETTHGLGGTTGTIQANAAAAVEFLNTRHGGNLTVSKTVAGNAGDTTKDFSFTVTLGDTSISGTYGDMSFTDGVATFSLKHGESKTAENLPNGMGYTVTEADYTSDGYVMTTDDLLTGNIVGQETKEIAVINTRNAYGSLTVSKTLAGNDTDPDKEFEFTITLSPAVNGTFSEVEFTDGVATITLKGGESKVFNDLPNGTRYFVTEADYESDGYVTTATGDTGTISETAAAVAAFTNTRNTYGDLTVTKKVTGNAGDKTKAFNFTVALTDTSISGAYGDMNFANGVATFTLKHGESKTAKNLPNGVEYTVTEADYRSSGYTTTKTGDTGTIVGGGTKTAAFENASNTYGALTISKTVTGDLGDKSKPFTFTVTFDDGGSYPYSGTYSGSIRSGESIRLRHGESITIYNLPNGTSYSVTESDNEGYLVYKSGETGIIQGNTTATAKFTNVRSTIPYTGDRPDLRMWGGLMLCSFMGIVGTVLSGRKKRTRYAPRH